MDIKKTNKKKLSTLIKQQVPQFVLEDHPKFTEFLTSYFLFMESAELNLDTFTEIDQILLETVGVSDSFVLLNQTDKNGRDKGNKVVDEENTFGGSFRKGEIITGSVSGATSTVLAEDTIANNRLFISANNGWITGETLTGSISGATAKVAKYRANPVENIQQLLNYTDPDHTISDFLSQMKKEFLNTIPEDTDDDVDTRKLIKNIKSLYRAKGTAKAHKAFFKILFNENSEIYTPADDMLRVSDGSWNVQTFIRCTQTTLQQAQDPIFLTGQTITQVNNPASTTINEATAIVENIIKFQEGSTQIIEVILNLETITGTFVNGAEVTGISNVDSDQTIGMVVSQGLSTATITNNGNTLTVGDEATLTGGAGAGARVQVLDISGAGVSEVIVNAAGQNYLEGDTLTFSSGTAEAKVAVVGGGFAPEEGSLDIHVELETATITGGGSGDLLLEPTEAYEEGKFLDESTQMVDTQIRTSLENEIGSILQEEYIDNSADRVYVVNQEHSPNIPYDMNVDDHIVLENFTARTLYEGDKIVQQNATGTGDITDVRMIASGSGYTTLPTATIDGTRFIGLQDATETTRNGIFPQQESVEDQILNSAVILESGQRILSETNTDHFSPLLNFKTTDFSRIEFEDGGRVLNESSFAVLNVVNGTVIPYGGDIGRATSLNIIEHGINYTSAPTLEFPHYAVLKTVSGVISANETFTSNVSGATGTVIDFTAPLLKYTATTSELVESDTITTSGNITAIVTKSDPLTGTATIGALITTAGKYINQNGHLSEGSKKIQDSLYYQDYSYVVKVAESINKWRDALKRAVHPSGFYVTGEVNIQTKLAGGVKQPVGATLAQGLFSGTSDSPIYMRLNTLFNTIFSRRTGVGFKFMSNAIQLDGKTLVSTATARTGKPVEVHNDYRDTSTNTEKELNLYPETTLDLERRSRTNFYTNTSYEVRSTAVKNGYAYAGPRLNTLNTFGLSAYAANNAITLEGGTGAGEILLEGATDGNSGVLQNDGSDSFSTTMSSWADLRFSGTLNTSVDGETIRLSDLSGSTSNKNAKTNFAFPTEVSKST